MTLSRPEVLRLLEESGISPSRALGQNFVADPNTVRRVARLAGVGARRPGGRDRRRPRVADAGPGRDGRLGDRRRAGPLAGPGPAGGSWPTRPRRAPVTVVEADAMTPGLGRRCWCRPTAGCWSPICLTTSRPRWWPTCWTACPPSSGCWSWSSGRWPTPRGRRRASPPTAPYR